MYNRVLPETHRDDGAFTATSYHTQSWKILGLHLYPLLLTPRISNNPVFVISTSSYLRICLLCFHMFTLSNLILNVMFSIEFETLCDYFHKFKQSISFCVPEKPKLFFQHFPKFLGTNCSVR